MLADPFIGLGDESRRHERAPVADSVTNPALPIDDEEVRARITEADGAVARPPGRGPCK
jgi:hypothetical protein